MLYCAGCLTVTDLLPYLYLGNVLLRGINSLLSRTTLLLSVCFAGIHTVLYDFQALIPILQAHLSKTIKLYDRYNLLLDQSMQIFHRCRYEYFILHNEKPKAIQFDLAMGSPVKDVWFRTYFSPLH